MSIEINSQFTDSHDQISTWLRGLMTVAWADGHFDPEEQSLIEDLVATELVPEIEQKSFQPISAEALAQGLGKDARTAENFLRTAVMVALVDGMYSSAEDELLMQFSEALQVQVTVLESLRATLDGDHSAMEAAVDQHGHPHNVLEPVQHWLDELEVHDPKLARFLCKLIPSQCPFERDVTLFGYKVVHIPPMCKLNPLYEQLVGLRFRALSYLADECKGHWFLNG